MSLFQDGLKFLSKEVILGRANRRPVEVVILAGGEGNRLRPYTTLLPKPLMPVGGRPILEIIIKQLKNANVKKITIAVNYMAEMIMTLLGDGKKFGIEIVYSIEETPLGTVGPLKQIQNLPDHFLVMNGDTLTNLNYSDFFASHQKKNGLLSIATCRRHVKVDFGVLEINRGANQLHGFQEKPMLSYDVSMGVYAFSKKVLDRVPERKKFGFDQLVLGMLQEKVPIEVYPFDGYWLDLGRPEDFDQANVDIVNNQPFLKDLG